MIYCPFPESNVVVPLLIIRSTFHHPQHPLPYHHTFSQHPTLPSLPSPQSACWRIPNPLNPQAPNPKTAQPHPPNSNYTETLRNNSRPVSVQCQFGGWGVAEPQTNIVTRSLAQPSPILNDVIFLKRTLQTIERKNEYHPPTTS